MGVVVIGFASAPSLFDNLIEAVNILGSIFHGTILGCSSFFLRWVTATPVSIGAAFAQTLVATLLFATDLGFLWFNVIGVSPSS